MPRERGIKKKRLKKKVEEIKHQKEKLQILDCTILAKPRTIYVSSSRSEERRVGKECA